MSKCRRGSTPDAVAPTFDQESSASAVDSLAAMPDIFCALRLEVGEASAVDRRAHGPAHDDLSPAGSHENSFIVAAVSPATIVGRHAKSVAIE